ncbi:MAG: helix-turn-helix domain-containing protein [Pedosphaera parvula]|nr:helix-turn-helix domain-containing protein [Pedosphaera parvula]
MPTVAQQLHQAREAQNLSIHDVAEATKIKSEHVRALEEGEYDVFSAPIYIRGFVRTYARMLKLDVPAIMCDLDVELARTEKFREPPRLTGQRHGPLDFIMFHISRVNWRLVLPAGIVVLIVAGSIWGYRAWRTHQAADPLSNLGPGLYQTPASGAGQTLPLPANRPKK